MLCKGRDVVEKDAYLFVYFKEKTTEDGEQVYFALSKDGLSWEQVNGGEPVLWSTEGECGVRDHTIVRTKGSFYIVSTDLSLARNFNTKYNGSWGEVSRHGSKHLVLWQSNDLVHWSEPRLIKLGDEQFGCLWAPDIFYDAAHDDYIIHWSSSHASNDYGNKGIYYTRTKDFEHFEKPELLYQKEDSGVIDSAIYKDGHSYYCFLKSEKNPEGVILLQAEDFTGPYKPIYAFNEEMAKLGSSAYEAPTAYQLADGRWCLMIDFFGVRGEGQGYVPFIADDIATGKFIRSDESFSFPYRFKHGTVLSITGEEYEVIKAAYPK